MSKCYYYSELFFRASDKTATIYAKYKGMKDRHSLFNRQKGNQVDGINQDFLNFMAKSKDD